MTPLAVLNAIVFGSSVAISFGLIGVWIIFLVLSASSDQVQFEMQRLPLYCLGLLSMAGISGAALYSLLKQLKWRWQAQGLMWVALLVLGYLAWPKGMS